MFLGSSKRVSYRQEIDGIWGEFQTPAGRVNFLMTKARLANAEGTSESRLTAQLCPVREVLDITKMNFNQLLQRDLDDHRVATELIPYLIQNRGNPAFFPPILAALLPFKGKDPADEFPGAEYRPSEILDGFGNQPFEEWRYGSAYRFQRMIDEEGLPHAVKLGRLGWNDEFARLVVLDGQHRAMALIAIERTLSRTWAQSTGNKYRHFYEHRIKTLLELAGAGDEQDKLDLTGVEFPVTICWFPDHSSPGRNPHEVARKLFVDVNKNARQPSEARLVLLSDTELINIFTRALLNRLRSKNPPFPLYAVEYDNPDKESSRPVRWTVFTNITMLRSMVEKAVFGPSKYTQNMSATFGGRPNVADMNDYMRRQLLLEEIFPEEIGEIDERTVRRSAIANDHFPQYNKKAQEKLVDRFMERWGESILHVLAELLPYKRHVEAVQEMWRGWLTDDAIASLAKDAMFEGVGMYWTLRESNTHWHEQDKARLPGEPPKDTPEIVKAWQVIESKGADFKTLRTKHLLGVTDAASVTRSEALYTVANTYACQLGAVMTLATIHADQSKLTVMELAGVLTQAWNAAFKGTVAKGLDRRCILSKEEKHPLNMIPKMDSPHAIYFRYFFLQLLAAPEAQAVWDGQLAPDALVQRIEEARWAYLKFLIKEKAKGYKRTQPSWKPVKREEKAKEAAANDLAGALKYWFKVPTADFDTWLKGVETTPEQDLDEEDTPEAESQDDSDDLLDELESLLDV